MGLGVMGAMDAEALERLLERARERLEPVEPVIWRPALSGPPLQTFRSWLDTADATDVQYAEDIFDELDADASFLILGNAATQQRARDEEGCG